MKHIYNSDSPTVVKKLSALTGLTGCALVLEDASVII